MSTRQRILDTALQLFNHSGERAVSTNHIATELGISPGNLYYHFNNKQAIIFELFCAYEQRLLADLALPDRALSIEDKLGYLQKVFSGLWDFRFLHRDMEHLLDSDDQLRSRYQQFYPVCLAKVEGIYQGLADAGILTSSPAENKDLALNTWIMVTAWFSFLRIHRAGEQSISRDRVWAGIYQVFTLERPYLSDAYKEQVEALQQRLLNAE